MSDLRIWEIGQEACRKFKASLEYSMRLHFKTLNNNNQNNKKYVYQDSQKNECQFVDIISYPHGLYFKKRKGVECS